MGQRITALQPQARHRNRVDVFIDGAYAFSVQDILAARLAVGQELDEPAKARLRAQDLVERAYEGALRYLALRPRSEQEVRRYLAKKGWEQGIVNQVLDRLSRTHLVDDRDFARFWVENRAAHRPRGQWALRYELLNKGVAGETIAAALAEVDEEGNALAAAKRLLPHLAHLDEVPFRRRLVSALQRRGFTFLLSCRVVERLWRELHTRQEANPEERAEPDDQ